MSSETLHQELSLLKKDVAFIKEILSEDFELSDHALKALRQARKTPEAEYIDLE